MRLAPPAAGDSGTRRRAAAELVIANADLREQIAAADRGRDELNDRVGALADELSEAQHDRQVLATENGALRDELDAARADAAMAEVDLMGARAEIRIVELERDTAAAELAAARRAADAGEARDHERARQAMLDNDRDGAV